MSPKSTVYKAHLQLSDLDRNHYADYPLTLALHPSETELRLMVRVLAFARYADERLNFTKGLCVDDEPDLWQHSLSGEVELWIEVGLPSDKRIRKACGRSERVVVIAYGTDQQVEPWWKNIKGELRRFRNLECWRLPEEQGLALAELAARQMYLQCTIQDGQLWWTGEGGSAEVTLQPMGLDY